MTGYLRPRGRRSSATCGVPGRTGCFVTPSSRCSRTGGDCAAAILGLAYQKLRLSRLAERVLPPRLRAAQALMPR